MKKYFTHLLKKNLITLACLTLFCIICYVVPMIIDDYSMWNDHVYNFVELYYVYLAFALGLISIFVPIFIFSYKMNKRSVDMHFSLPISRTKILIVNFLVGLVLMYASYSAVYWLGFIVVAAKVKHLYLINYLYMYLASIIPAFITYAFTAFIFTRANKSIDGILCVLTSLSILALAVITILEPLPYSLANGFSAASFFPFASLAHVYSIFGDAIKSNNIDIWLSAASGTHAYKSDISAIIGDVIWMLIAIASTIGLILTEKNGKVESCGQVSDSIFCYKGQIPIYTVLILTISMIMQLGVIFIIIMAFFIFVWSIIYKRTAKIGWKFSIVLAACAAAGLILGAILSALN